MGWNRGLLRARRTSRLLSLDDVLAALGDDGIMGRRTTEVPLADVVGSVSRPDDFDQTFRLVNASLRERWKDLAAAVQSGLEPPPVSLIQLGDLYFVNDGHHRVSVACSLRRDVISAKVLRVCTIAYATCRLRLADLPTKAAERRFLERVPLAVDLRCDLWLEGPADWQRLADAAEAWGFRRALEDGRPPDRGELARAWWAEEVMPTVRALRRTGRGHGRRAVQVYADAQAADAAGRVLTQAPEPSAPTRGAAARIGWPACPVPATSS